MDIERLKKDRMNLQLRIKKWYDKGKDATELVYNYHELLNKLRSHGIKAEAKAEYLQKHFWDNKYKIASNKNIKYLVCTCIHGRTSDIFSTNSLMFLKKSKNTSGSFLAFC